MTDQDIEIVALSIKIKPYIEKLLDLGFTDSEIVEVFRSNPDEVAEKLEEIRERHRS